MQVGTYYEKHDLLYTVAKVGKYCSRGYIVRK